MKRKPVFVFDLDETLISTAKRQYSVMSDFFHSKNIEFPYNINEYSSLRKNNNLSNSDFFKIVCGNPDHFNAFRLFYSKFIESTKYLDIDSLIVDIELLAEFTSSLKIDLILISLRSNKSHSSVQLDRLNLKRFFLETIFLNHDAQENPKTHDLKRLQKIYNIVGFVGDSQSDFEASTETKIPFYKVNTGIYAYSINSEVYDNINEFLLNQLKYAKIQSDPNGAQLSGENGGVTF